MINIKYFIFYKNKYYALFAVVVLSVNTCIVDFHNSIQMKLTNNCIVFFYLSTIAVFSFFLETVKDL